MGLLYPFPIQEDEGDHAISQDSSLLLKSYGLPYLFWGYLLAGLTILGVMAFAIRGPLKRILLSEDSLNFFLGALTLFSLGATAVGFTSLFFVEFRLFKQKDTLIKSLYCFGIPLGRRHFHLRGTRPFEITHFSGSPNMASLENRPGMEGHQNRGYFELYLHTHDEKTVLLDRHSRKIDLEKLQHLLEKF